MRTPGKQTLFALGLLFACFTAASAQTPSGDKGANGRFHTANRMSYELIGGVVTLYPRDRLASSLCFLDGNDGLIIEQGEVRNRCSHLRIENRELESIGTQELFAVGVQGGQYGVLVDLGEESQITKRYGYLTWPGAGFTSIRLSEGKVSILKDNRTKAFEELKETAPLLEATTSRPNSNAARPIVVGHIYIARITDRDSKNMDMWVKILVLAHTPGQMVTMRWELL
jgi:hypothetical protein